MNVPDFSRISFYLLEAMGRLRWDRQRLEDYQKKRLRKVVRYAYAYVPYYHKIFKESGLTPSEINNVDVLSRLPITRKSDLKKQPYRNLISVEYADAHLKALKTGGSTGEPFTLYINKKEDAWRKAVYLRANASCGQRPRDRWVAVLDAERASDTSFVQHATRIFAKQIIPVTWTRAAQLNAIEKAGPDVLDGFPSALWMLARETELKGQSSVHPRLIFGSGELISKSSRRYLERVFEAPYYDQFGCTEIDRSAWQCPEKNGYHIDVDSVVMQFVDHEGEEVGSGERGEIVYTSLFNYAMPIIRYSTRDIGIRLDQDCPCGRSLPLMSIMEGRDNSFLVFPDGHIVSAMSFIETLKAFLLVKEIEQYRVVQRSTDLIEILIKKAHEGVDESRVRDWLLTNISRDLPKVENLDLQGVRFEVKFVDSLPLTRTGKLNVVTSNVTAFN